MGMARMVVLIGAFLSFGQLYANAGEWIVRPDQSAIGFLYERAGQPAEGKFARFSGSGTFDPVRPEHARLTLRIDTSSIDLFDTLASGFATSAEWFDSKNHPDVVYQLTGLTVLGNARYQATGTITIRGESEVLRSPVFLVVSETHAHANGALDLDRRRFGLGVGPSAAFVEIGDRVSVRFDLVAEPVN